MSGVVFPVFVICCEECMSGIFAHAHCISGQHENSLHILIKFSPSGIFPKYVAQSAWSLNLICFDLRKKKWLKVQFVKRSFVEADLKSDGFRILWSMKKNWVMFCCFYQRGLMVCKTRLMLLKLFNYRKNGIFMYPD